ncbi:zinc knuckle CX2CX4HX4C containing protein [Tanacetum coccineum]
MSTNRPKRNIKPSTKFGDFVCSNMNVKSVNSSTVKAGKDKMNDNSGENFEDIDTNVINNSLNDNGSQEVRVSDDTKEVNGECNNEEKQVHSKEEKNDAELIGVKKGMNADGDHTKAKVEIDKRLIVIPTEMDGNGSEVVVFDEVMVAEGSKRWEKTLCGYFFGYSMSRNELRYNLRRMWSRHGFKEIIDFNNGIYFIKFHSNEGLEYVVNNGPWMMTWTAKGISALASRVGKPMVMDQITTTLCKEVGLGMLESWWRCLKTVKVVYDWKPHICLSCCVFGHTNMRCGKKNVEEATKTIRKVTDMESNKDEGNKQRGPSTDNEGFTTVQKKKGKVTTEKVLKPNYKPNTQQPKGGTSKQGVMSRKPNPQFAYQPKKNEGVARTIPPIKPDQNEKVKNKTMKRSANKYYVLELYDENEICELNDIKNKEIFKGFIKQKRVPTESDMLFWNIDMVAYYKQRKEQESSIGKSIKDKKGRTNKEENDMFKDDSGMTECLNVNEMMGMDRGILSDC